MSGKTALAALFRAAFGHLLVVLCDFGIDIGILFRKRTLVDLVGAGFDSSVEFFLGSRRFRRLGGFTRHATRPTRRLRTTNGRPGGAAGSAQAEHAVETGDAQHL